MVLTRCRQPANGTVDAEPYFPYRRLDRAPPSRGLARLSTTVFRFAVSATVAYPALDVAYDGLPAVIDMNMLDANVLLSPVTQPSKNLYLHRIRPH